MIKDAILDLMFDEIFEKYDKYDEEYRGDKYDEISNKFFSKEYLTSLVDNLELTENETIASYYDYVRSTILVHLDGTIDYNIVILLRRIVMEFFETNDINKIITMIENRYKDENEFIPKKFQDLIELMKEKEWITKEQLVSIINEKVEKIYNWDINCGGYALKIRKCVYNYDGSTERIVTDLLEKLDFVRLLGETELQDDEYVVLYRVCEEGGHHFVRIEDGIATEKQGTDPVQNFDGWYKGFSRSKDIVLAVKKKHDYELRQINGSVWLKPGEIFDERAERIIKEGKNTFEYHSHGYVVDKDNGIIFSGDKVVADILSEGDEFTVVVREDTRDYISNFRSKYAEKYIKQAVRTETIDR
jgi:hypothetical protein